MIDILLDALLISLILLGIHAYFGMEIVKRGVIFTDLAIAQSASFGVALALIFGWEKAIPYLSITFALIGGFLIYLSEKRKFREALIGLLYAIALSAAFIVLSKSPNGAEEFLKLTATDILFTPRKEILTAGAYYAVIGVLIYLNQRFFRGRRRDFFFYILFALTVSSSVKLAGTLVVFSLLLSPPLLSLSLKRGILFAWIYGALINILAILASYFLDLPTGFSIVFFQALFSFVGVLTISSLWEKHQE